MPKQVLVESRNQTLTFPDDATQEEINQAVSEAFPREGQDVAFDLQKFQQQGGDVKDFIASIPDDDYIKLNNFRSDKKMTAAEMGGIALDAAGTLVKDVLKGAYAAGKTMVEAPAKGDNLATAKVLSSAARGVGAGTIDLAQLGLKLIDPTQRIPTYDEFAKQPVTDYGYAYGPAPSVTSRAATPEDYKTLVDSERKKELAALEMVDVADKLVQGASIEDVAKGARFVDAFTITGLAKGLAKGVGKGIAKKGFYESAAGLPAATKAAELTAKAAETAGNLGATGVQAAAKTVETAAKVANAPINLARNLIKNETAQALVGAGLGYRQGDIEGAIAGTLGATVGLRAASAALKGIAAGADFIGSAAKVAKTGASRSGLFEKMAVDSGISQSARNIAKALLPTQPAFQFAGQVAKETAKDFIPAAGIGAGLGYMAGGEEGAAAGIGSALGVSALTGPIKASVSAVKTLAKAPTARGDANALGDIKTFVNAIPDEKSRIQYAQIMDQAIKVAGPERAADMLDALRLAEAHGATVVVGPKNSPNAFDIVGNTISVNPSRLNAGTVFHETTHQLVNVGIRASLLPELRNLYDGIRDADGNILKPGLYTEADWAAKAKELAESYKNNPQGYQMALDVASKLENPAGYSPEAIQAAKDFVLDEATASYAERLMGRSRPGAFNPDRLPMWHRNLLEQIDQRVLDKLSTELYSGQTNLNTPSKAFTDANGRPVRIPQLDVILRKALSGKYPKSGGAIPKQAAPKTVPIPKNPVDVAKFAQATFGATRDILGTDENGNPRLLTEKEHQDVAKADYEAAVQAFQQLSPDDQATVRLVNRKGEPASITDKDYQIQITSATPSPVFERFLQVAKDRGMGNQQLAAMRQLYASMVSPEGPTFDTVNNPVWKYSKRTGQMESTVRPPTRQEIYPLFIHVNSAGGFNVKYIDLSRLKQNAQKIMSDPKHKGVWPSMDAFMDDFKRSMRNLSAEGKQPDTPSGSKSTAELLGNGDENLGAVKRDLIAEALNVTLPERLKSKGYENEPVFEPLSLIGKEKRGKRIGESAFRDFRIERVTEITPTNERLKVVQENAYDKLVRRFQPDSFIPETLPNGEAWTNPEGYRILKKTGSKLYRVYDDSNESIGVASTFDKAVKMAQRKFIDGWHGSPHNFMRFTTQKIGTGEGQAYGHGIYISENRNVGQSYKGDNMGSLYRVQLNVLPEQLLDWDKPLSEQSDSVKKAIGYSERDIQAERNLMLRSRQEGNPIESYPEYAEMMRSIDFSQSYKDATGGEWYLAQKMSDKDTSEFLKKKGIPGIRYFGEGSEGTSNYVIFDDGLIRIIDRNGKSVGKRLFRDVAEKGYSLRFQPDAPTNNLRPLTAKALSTDWESYPKTRGELTKEKIITALKGVRNIPVSQKKLAQFVASYDSAEDLLNHTYYHGTQNIVSTTLKPSITLSERQAEQMGGGGYGERYWAISLSKSKRKSEAFAGQSRSVRVHPVLLKKSAKVIEIPGVTDAADLDKYIVELWNNKIDAVWIGGGEQELAVINPKAIVFSQEPDTYAVFGGYKSEDFTLDKAKEVFSKASEFVANPELSESFKLRFQPDESTTTKTRFQSDPIEQKMEKATLRGMHGAWISPVGEVAKVASLYGHADVIESLMKGLKINNADDYNKAYDKQFARVVNTPDTIYITTTKPLSSSQKASAELLGIVNEKRVILENPNNGKQSTLYSVVRFQPDPSMPSVLNGSNGTRIIKSNSGKFRVYSGTGALLGIRDTQQAAEKLARNP